MGAILISILTSMAPGFLKLFGKKLIAGGAGSFFTKNITLMLVIVALIVGAASGWYVTSKFADAARLKAAESALEAQSAAIVRTIKEYDEQRALDDEVTTGLIEDLSEIAASIPATIEVNNYVPENDPVICNVPVGSLMQLNHARTGAGDFLPKTTGISDDAAKTPSSVTRSDEYVAHAECGIEFRTVKANLERLQQWNKKTYEKYKNHQCTKVEIDE